MYSFKTYFLLLLKIGHWRQVSAFMALGFYSFVFPY